MLIHSRDVTDLITPLFEIAKASESLRVKLEENGDGEAISKVYGIQTAIVEMSEMIEELSKRERRKLDKTDTAYS